MAGNFILLVSVWQTNNNKFLYHLVNQKLTLIMAGLCCLISSCPGFAQSDEAAPIERLLDAYYECDQEAADRVTKSPLFKFMENDVSSSYLP